MGSFTRGPTVTLAHDGTALGKYLRVKWSGTALSVCANNEKAIGTLEDDVLSGETAASVRLFGEVRRMVAAGAFAVGADIYRAAGGKVDDAVVASQDIGQALEAASGDGSEVEVVVLNALAMPA